MASLLGVCLLGENQLDLQIDVQRLDVEAVEYNENIIKHISFIFHLSSSLSLFLCYLLISGCSSFEISSFITEYFLQTATQSPNKLQKIFSRTTWLRFFRGFDGKTICIFSLWANVQKTWRNTCKKETLIETHKSKQIFYNNYSVTSYIKISSMA